jgi:2-succinyl-5-enolpyruvyl-6-hydroxy-3-cyclohexene-1-carboxylate synthase
LSDLGCRNLRWALALIDGLLAGGVRTLVLSPGARSTPVVLAAQRRERDPREQDRPLVAAAAAARPVATARAPGLALIPILDERSAAFFALGLARSSARPVAVLATSGSAPTHWYPAVVEADAAGLPLVLLSADRPPRLRGWGANQTIDQTRLFGPRVRLFHDPGLPEADPAALRALRALGLRATAVSLAPRPGPVHINLPFDEPLVPDGNCDPEPAEAAAVPRSVPMPAPLPAPASLGLDTWPRGNGLILCGPEAQRGPVDAASGLGRALWRCAGTLGLPVLTEPLSGLRAGFGQPEPTRPRVPNGLAVPGPCITRQDAILRNAEAAAALRPDWVLRLGRAPVSKVLGQWLRGIPTLLVDPTGLWADPGHDVCRHLPFDPAAVLRQLARGQGLAAHPAWLGAWTAAETRVGALADEHLATHGRRGNPLFEGEVIRLLLSRLKDGDGLFCGNSLPIRQLDTWSGPIAPKVQVLCNRGTSGIDGQLSTLAGLNRGGLPSWGLLGDLGFCHDLSGLLLTGGLDRPLLVLNNGGGRIFDELPQRRLPGLARLWRTPVTPDLAALTAAFELGHAAATDARALGEALDDALAAALSGGGPRLIEVCIDADASRACHQAFRARIAAMRGLAAPLPSG